MENRINSKSSFVIKSTSRSFSESSEYSCIDTVINRPKTLLDSCPLETAAGPLPKIVEKDFTKKNRRFQKKNQSASAFWLKPGISLPKLKKENITLDLRGDVETDEDEKEEIEEEEEMSTFDFKNEIKSYDRKSVSEDSQEAIIFPLEMKNEENDYEPTRSMFGPSKCQFKFTSDSVEFDKDEFQVPDETDYEPSHALRRWEEYVSQGKKLQYYLSRTLGRKPCDLLINQGEKYRKVCEDKNFFWLAQFLKPDKKKESCWWRPYPKQKKRAEYITYIKKCRKFLPPRFSPEGTSYPEMEIIGTPLVIQKEKGLICEDAPKSVSSTLEFWEQTPYRQEQMSTLKKERKHLKHDVHMFEFVIVGQKMPGSQREESEKTESRPEIPKIVCLNQDSEETEEPLMLSPASEKALLSIQVGDENISRYLGEENEQHSNGFVVREVNFGVNEVGALVEKVLRIENKGTVSVRYEWVPQKYTKRISLNVLRPTARQPWFFFNKNPGIFVPGQVYNLKFYNRTQKPGLKTEVWHLKTDPPMSSNGQPCKIILSSIVVEKNECCAEKKLDTYIQRRVAESIVKSILQSLICLVFDSTYGIPELEYRSLFWERDLFEYHNPKHYYHSQWVKELKQIYLEIPLIEDTEWDFSLSSLINLVRISGHRGENLNEKYQKIAGYAKKLLRPKYLSESTNKTYMMAYQYLCKMANLMEQDYAYFSICLSHRMVENSEKDSDSEEFQISFMTFGFDKDFPKSSEALYEISSINFQTMLYLRVYGRLCEAVEQIVGAIETNKLFTPPKEIDYSIAPLQLDVAKASFLYNPFISRPSTPGSEL